MSDAGADGRAVTGPDGAALRVEIVRKVYGGTGPEPVEAVRGLAFTVTTGAITCLIGPSGAGKTTTLRILLGLDPDYEGSVTPPPDEAGIAMAFQEPRLLPWRTVEQNVRLALPRPARGQNLDALFESLGLAPWRGRYPGALSLGMARRVSLARALAQKPRILILDEPFVSLDDNAAAALRGLVVAAVGTSGMGVLMVTHNVAEALEIADRLLLVSGRPASLLGTIPLDRPRGQRDRAWIEANRASLAGRFPSVIAG
ncbi:ABC transporter ATP-binding protein [Methylobacterium sp. Leaf104]|uniref:ABC transporter ATP-binding protein n=1 Tax=Methylobacterium TaxID=407 RepID=UPI0006F8DA79|nr:MULTISPECIES: ATP-binding cassette domain-containing protein [Methylobacterium]KQP41269.1 ABC transporter ATP-binding protein [Methylobacterium sp. Leaf104]MCI9879339.1 ATP-binding cassette domain-containing protein [Methylobacterium goesingense]